jgi:undecaprenyl-diphosphatase
MRPPRCRVPWPPPARLALGAVLTAAVILAAMVGLDSWASNAAPHLPGSLLEAARLFTELGKSGWFLWPIGIVLLVMAMFDTLVAPRFARLVLAAWAVRLGFVFAAIAVPGLFVNVVKRVVGRARPFVEGTDIWAFTPFGWQAAYASLPSGHATTAFAALVAIGALFPRARAPMWIYAVLIALSRVVVSAHYPSDVLAGAVVGAAGALIVRHWFATRRLAFRVTADGAVVAMPGPSARRIVKAVARWRRAD